MLIRVMLTEVQATIRSSYMKLLPLKCLWGPIMSSPTSITAVRETWQLTFQACLIPSKLHHVHRASLLSVTPPLNHPQAKSAKNEQRRLLWWKNEARRQEQRGAENFSAIEIAPKISQITGLYCSKIRTFTQGPGARWGGGLAEISNFLDARMYGEFQ